MPQDQRYEYKSIELNALGFDEEGEERLNEIAKDGWRLKEKVDLSGNTNFFIFERPVE